MMKDDTVFLRHILEATETVEAYVAGLDHGSFVSNGMVCDAVVRRLEIIGEAARNLTETARNRLPRRLALNSANTDRAVRAQPGPSMSYPPCKGGG